MDINVLIPTYSNTYSDVNFLILIETHLDIIRSTSTMISVTEHQNNKFKGSFYDLLNDLGINPRFHLIVARVNNFKSSNDFKGDRGSVIVPDFKEIERLRGIFETKNKF